jgi:N-acetylmuramoyl-L-alanine amidase
MRPGLALLGVLAVLLASPAYIAAGDLKAGAVLPPLQPAAAGPHVVAIDPGHGGPESGATAGDLVERDLNLQIALDLAQQLRESGYGVVLTRTTAAAVNPEYIEAPNRPQYRRDLQDRIDIANGSAAEVFISIHNNGAPNAAERGTEIWYDPSRAFADRNQALAQLALDGIVSRVRAAGYDGLRRGLREDSHFRVFRDRAFPLYILGPGTTGFRSYEPTAMPGILGEGLFLTNSSDGAALHQADILHAIASGYADAIGGYFKQFP